MATVKAIASRDNPLLVRLRKLVADPAGYRKHGEVWLEGEHLCQAWLQRGGAVLQALITEAAWESAPLRALAQRAGAVALLPETLMKGLGTLESAAPLAFVVPWAATPLPEPRLASVVLDRLQDAGNVGTILRSAAAFGFGPNMIPNDRGEVDHRGDAHRLVSAVVCAEIAERSAGAERERRLAR